MNTNPGSAVEEHSVRIPVDSAYTRDWFASRLKRTYRMIHGDRPDFPAETSMH